MRYVAVFAVLVVFVLNSGCAIKGGFHYYDEDKYKKLGTGDAMELELSTPRIQDGKFDLVFNFGIVDVSKSSEKIDIVTDNGDGSYSLSTMPAWEKNLIYYTIGTRYYPFGIRAVTPVLGLGVGHYEYKFTSHGKGEGAACPAGLPQSSCYEISDKTTVIGRDYGYYGMAGIYIRLGEMSRDKDLFFSIEDKYHRANLDRSRNIDLSGHSLIFGFTVLWK